MIPTSEATFTLAGFSYDEVAGLVGELGLAEPLAIALARRGLGDVEEARRFLAAEESHDPSSFEGMGRAVAAIREAVEGGRRITVHGDYDVDGVTSTTILVAALREMGADADWLIPDRLGDGYGLSEAGVRLLAERGTGMIITVDCGITSVAEVALAKELGLGVVVTDHHEPAAGLPDCPIVHPRLGGYPCPDLCGAAVAHKLVGALLGVERAERDLDLVALATVADMVSLTGENRSLVRRGLALARRAPRPGMRALMVASSVTPERLTEIDVSFRLAPRINAAGRLYRADAGVELLLSDDADRAERIAVELDRANHERRETEGEVLAEAEAAVRALGPEADEAAALVLWGEGWHPGVVGICASRIVERYGKPALLIAIDADGRGKGSGRSVAGFDLLGGLRACEGLLSRYGGHVAAAGLEIERSNLEALRAAFVAHAGDVIAAGPAVAPEPVDAVVGGEALGLDTAEQLRSLAPFGRGNPELRLLVPSAQVSDVRPMGETGRHARFSLATPAGRAAGVAFGVGESLERMSEQGRLDLIVKLEMNEWNGAVEPRVVLERALEIEPGAAVQVPSPATGEELWRRIDAALEPAEATVAIDPELLTRSVVEAPGGGALAKIADLAASGEPTLVICADAVRRAGLIERALDPRRFGGAVSVVAGRRSLLEAEWALAEVLAAGTGAVLTDWRAIELMPGLAEPFEHLVLVDPPPDRRSSQEAAARGRGGGWVHRAYGPAEVEFAERVYLADAPSRGSLAALYRAVRDAGGDPELAVLDTSAAPRSPELTARLLAVLGEIGVVRMDGTGPDRRLGVVSSDTGGLESSPTYRAGSAGAEETTKWLSELKQGT